MVSLCGQAFLKRTGYSSVFQNVSFSPLPAGSMRGFFSDLRSEDLVKPWELKFTKAWGFPLDFIPLEFLALRLVHTEPLAICQLPPRLFLSRHQRLLKFLFMDCCSGRLCFSVCTHLPRQCLGPGLWLALWPHFTDGSKKGCSFFSLYSFLLIVRMGWQHLNSLCAGLETRG